MANVNTIASNDDNVVSSTGMELMANINMHPLIGLMLAILSGAISVGAGYLVYILVFSN